MSAPLEYHEGKTSRGYRVSSSLAWVVRHHLDRVKRRWDVQLSGRMLGEHVGDVRFSSFNHTQKHDL